MYKGREPQELTEGQIEKKRQEEIALKKAEQAFKDAFDDKKPIEEKPIEKKEKKEEVTFENYSNNKIHKTIVEKAEEICEHIKVITVRNFDGEILYLQDKVDLTYKVLMEEELFKQIDKFLLSQGMVVKETTTKHLARTLKVKAYSNLIDYEDIKNNILVKNGLIEIRDDEVLFTELSQNQLHEQISFRRIDLEYNKNLYKQENKLVDKFFNDIMINNPDLVNYLWHILATPFIDRRKYEKAFVFYGETGSNGKSVLAETMQKVYGKQNVTNVELGAMSGWNLALMDRGYVNWVGDMEKYGEWTNFKKITSGESIVMDVKFKNPVEKEIATQLFINSNVLPTLGAMRDGGYTRRLEFIPFLKTFEGDERDPKIFKKLAKKENLEWILSKLINIVEELQEDFIGSWFKENKPQAVKDLFEEQKIDDSSAIAFIDWLRYNLEWNETDNLYRIKYNEDYDMRDRVIGKFLPKNNESLLWPTKIYNLYREFCENEGNKPYQKKNFLTHIKEIKDIKIDKTRKTKESLGAIIIPNQGFMKIGE